MKLIVATDDMGGIARADKIPWKCKEDMDFFRLMTLNQTVIMGRKTYQSIGKPLPERINVVITSNQKLIDEQPTQGVIYSSLENTFNTNRLVLHQDSWVIGGAQLYDYVLTNYFVSEIFISRIRGNYNCDLMFGTPLKIKLVELCQLKLSDQCTIHKFRPSRG